MLPAAASPYVYPAPPPAMVPYGYPAPPVMAPAAAPMFPHYAHSVPANTKDFTVALLLWLFLGHFGADQFYLGRPGPGVGIIVLWFLGLVTISFFGLGLLFWIPVGIWWIVHGCMLSRWVREHNARRAYGLPDWA